MSIRARLLIIALLAVLVPALLAWRHFREVRNDLVAVETQRLKQLAQNQVDELRQRILATTQLQFGLTRARDLAEGDRASCSDFLSYVREAHPQYTGILTIQPNGRLFCDSLRSGRELDLNDRDYFRRALGTRGETVLEPAFGRLTGRAVLQVAYPVRRSDDSLQFVLLASLDLAKAMFAADERLPASRLLLIDDKGQVLAVSPKADDDLRPGASVAGSALGRFAAESRGAGMAMVEMGSGGRYRWARADNEQLSSAGLRVLAGAPEATIVAKADQRFRRDMGLYALLAAGVLALVLWMSERGVRRPLARMTKMADRLAAGDLESRVDSPLPTGELGVLAASLNHAAKALGAQRADIENLHAQLLQSQRLEAVGQLTGGVAHDFNNLLTVVLGNADLLAEPGLPEAQRAQALQMLVGAAERGATLTKQLLAFARKQPLAPSEVDVNSLVASFDPLLRRTLGEQIGIEFVRGAGLWTAMVDPTQLESALLNLCLNARDAMPRGGRLTVETANAAIDQRYTERYPDVEPGQYVLLAVSYTGSGIDPAHLSRVFEPFFTTKEKGKGTGLGLAMVHGFVKQSGGHVGIYSEPGHGTTVKLYLPRAVGLHGGVERMPAASEARGGDETVLVVEDDDPVRVLAGLELRAMGYRVLQARSGAEALELLRSEESVDLLFTDIVMPGGMTGRELADEAGRIRPGLRILFTSGYTENAIVHHGRLDPGVQLLPKPYRKGDLARAVRHALERPVG